MKIRKKKEIPTLVGQRFGKLVVVEQTSCDITGKANHHWLTICDCGNEKETNSWCLKYNKTTSCGCYQRERWLESTVKHTKNFALNALVYEYKVGAKKRGLEFTLTHEDCDYLFSQNCFYCDSEPFCVRETQSKNYKHKIVFNGIDRINNKEGYTKSNSVTCCKFCNVAKHDMELNEFLNWVNRLSRNLMKKNYIITDGH